MSSIAIDSPPEHEKTFSNSDIIIYEYIESRIFSAKIVWKYRKDK
jgi:hypothetical protein